MARVNKSKPYGRTTWRGVTLENRTVSALEWAEKHWRKGVGKGQTLRPSQGSFSTSVGASGQTHAGGGACDLSVAGMTPRQRRRLVRWLRRAGICAWYRAPSAIWGPHIHLILPGRTNSSAAKWQVGEYNAHRTGLTAGAFDPTWRPRKPRRWSHRRNKPIVK